MVEAELPLEAGEVRSAIIGRHSVGGVAIGRYGKVTNIPSVTTTVSPTLIRRVPEPAAVPAWIASTGGEGGTLTSV